MTERSNAADFWQWAYTDFLSNTLRGVLAEYIVAQALDCTTKPRTEWNAYDLLSQEGVKIEVKSAAYLQNWTQKQSSPIRFDIGLKRGWDASTNTYASKSGRAADVYVFCLFHEQVREKANPLILEQWTFLVCPTLLINHHFPEQKTVSLAKLEALGLRRITFNELNGEIKLVSSLLNALSLAPLLHYPAPCLNS